MHLVPKLCLGTSIYQTQLENHPSSLYMARTRYKIYNQQQPHFLTMTIVEWIPLFMNKENVSIILDSFKFIQTERTISIYAYVIIENHLHVIVSGDHLIKTIKEFKSFTARKVIDYLKDHHSVHLLELLKKANFLIRLTAHINCGRKGVIPRKFSVKKCSCRRSNIFTITPCGEDMLLNRNIGIIQAPKL